MTSIAWIDVRSLLWGLGVGLLAATGVGFGPVIVIALLEGNLREFEEVGGLARYLTWAYTAGIVGGLTAGLLRPVARSGIALRTACGLILAEVFALQPIVFDLDDVGIGTTGLATIMGTMFFFMGFIFGPLMIAGFKHTWPEQLLNWGASDAPDDDKPDPSAGGHDS